jgi:hypothetical protein
VDVNNQQLVFYITLVRQQLLNDCLNKNGRDDANEDSREKTPSQKPANYPAESSGGHSDNRKYGVHIVSQPNVLAHRSRASDA